jgi:hypothetical protein
MTEETGNRRWIWVGLAALIVVVGAAAIFWFTQHQGATEPAVEGPEAYKTGFVENCLKQANAAALQQGKPYNEEQKRILQQVCGCGADRTLQQFTPQDIAAFKANPNDETMLNRIKGIMQGCATATQMPATNP